VGKPSVLAWGGRMLLTFGVAFDRPKHYAMKAKSRTEGEVSWWGARFWVPHKTSCNMSASSHWVILVRDNDTPTFGQRTIDALLKAHEIPRGIISPDATFILSLTPSGRPASIGSCVERSVRKASVTPFKRLNKTQARPGYDANILDTRLGMSIQYVILRPDFYVFATAKEDCELGVCLQGLERMIS
jgi:hypothetical protein